MPEPEVVFEGTNLIVEAANPGYLLAMKLTAAGLAEMPKLAESLAGGAITVEHAAVAVGAAAKTSAEQVDDELSQLAETSSGNQPQTAVFATTTFPKWGTTLEDLICTLCLQGKRLVAPTPRKFRHGITALVRIAARH